MPVSMIRGAERQVKPAGRGLIRGIYTRQHDSSTNCRSDSGAFAIDPAEPQSAAHNRGAAYGGVGLARGGGKRIDESGGGGDGFR